MLTMMKKICRPAWPNNGACEPGSRVTARNTVNSRTFPTIPTGQAQTLRRIPPTAEAKPKALPRISRQVIGWPAMITWAS